MEKSVCSEAAVGGKRKERLERNRKSSKPLLLPVKNKNNKILRTAIQAFVRNDSNHIQIYGSWAVIKITQRMDQLIVDSLELMMTASLRHKLSYSSDSLTTNSLTRTVDLTRTLYDITVWRWSLRAVALSVYSHLLSFQSIDPIQEINRTSLVNCVDKTLMLLFSPVSYV